MLTSKQFRILGAFRQSPFGELSFGEIKKILREKSNSVIQNAILKFKKENLVIEKKVGTSKFLRLNMENEAVYSHLSLMFENRLNKRALKDIIILRKEIEKYTFFYSLVVFGSYADNTQRKISDLDVAIIIPNKSEEHEMKTAINSASNKSIIKIDAHIITEDEFLRMLEADYENVGKQIAAKNAPLHNIKVFYKLVNKSMKHGFHY